MEERLTMKRGKDIFVFASHYWVGGDGFCRGQAIDRLAAYEDTGLTPEEVMELLDTSHLWELWRLEKSGRMVVLNSEEQAHWVRETIAERDRQNKKWGFPQLNTFCEWSSILTEEVGELAQELNELNFGRGDIDRMITEDVQVAAVAFSILEHRHIMSEFTEKVMAARRRMLEAEAARKEAGTSG